MPATSRTPVFREIRATLKNTPDDAIINYVKTYITAQNPEQLHLHAIKTGEEGKKNACPLIYRFGPPVQGGLVFVVNNKDSQNMLAAVLAHVPTWTGMKKPVSLVLSAGDAQGDGARALGQALLAAGANPDLCIVSVPTGMNIAVANRSRTVVQVIAEVTGDKSYKQKVANADALAGRYVRSVQTVFVVNPPKGRKKEDQEPSLFREKKIVYLSPLKGFFEIPFAKCEVVSRHSGDGNILSDTTPEKSHVALNIYGQPVINVDAVHKFFEDKRNRVCLPYQNQFPKADAKIFVTTTVVNRGYVCRDAPAVALAEELTNKKTANLLFPRDCQAAFFDDAFNGKTVMIGAGPNPSESQLETLRTLMLRSRSYVCGS